MTQQTVAWLFPGQGSQDVGMGRDLATHPVARDLFAAADEALGFSLSALMFEGPKGLLDETTNTQPALFVHSVALLRVARAEGWLDEPAWVAGHSLGEYSALVAAGALAFEAGLAQVRERGRLMSEAGEQAPGGMAAIIGLEDAQVVTLCEDASREGEPVQVANYNCPGQVVVSGAAPAVTRLLEGATAAGARMAKPLDVSIAAHSPLMAPARDELARAIHATTFDAPTIPVVANVSARPIRTPEAIRDELVAQLTGSVRWTESMHFLIEQGVGRVVEIGAGSVLSGLMRRIDRGVERVTIASLDDLHP